MTVRVTVVGQYDGRSLAAAQRDLDKLKRAQIANSGPMGKMAAGLKNQLTPNFMAMGAAVAAAGAALAAFAVKLGVDGVRAAAEEEQAVAKLSTALKNVGQEFALGEVETFIDNMQRATGVADDELRPAMQTLVTATGNAAQSQDLLSLALDVSAASGKDLTSVAGALAKASKGQYTQINRLTNGAINPSILATKDLSLITGELTRLFGGQAQANAETFAGSMARLKIAADELLESFGAGFIDAFTESGDAAGEIGNSLKAAEPGMREFGNAIGELVRLMAIAAPAFNFFVDTLKYAVPAALAGAAAAFPPLIPFVSWIGAALKTGADTANNYADAVDVVGVKFSGPMSAGAQAAQRRLADMGGSIEEAEAALSALNDEMNEFFGFIDQRDAIRGYQANIDELRKSLKENGKNFDINTEAGRNNQEALDGVFQSALDVAEGQATAAEKIATMKDAARDAKTQLDKTNMSEEAKQRLLQPFDDAILKFETANTKVTNLKQEMERLPTNIPIRIDVETYYYGTPPPGGFPNTNGSAYGGFVDGYGGTRADDVPAWLSRGEFVIQAPAVSKFGRGFFAALNQGVNPLSSVSMPGPSTGGGTGGGGFVVETINVNAAPGERAEETVPRALRRVAFLAGV